MVRPKKAMGFQRAFGLVAATALLLGAASCAELTGDDRSAQIQQILVEDNRALLEREPYLTELKFKKMARSPYEFLRGTPSIFLHDLMQPGAWSTAYGTKASSRVLVMGDAHPENIGTYRREDGTYFLDYNDFDGVNWGPYHFEVRRLALTFSTLAYEIHGEDAPMAANYADQLAGDVATAYAEAITAMAAGGTPPSVQPGAPANAIANDLFSRSRTDGPNRDELLDYTELVDGERRLRSGVLRLPDGDILSRELWEVSERERDMVAALLQQWPETTLYSAPASLTRYALVDVRRRIGAGVSSYPILRYYALLRGPDEDPDDVIILDIKESRDGPLYAGVVRLPLRVFAHNAERTVVLQRAFQDFPDGDPLLGYAAVGALSFRIQDTTNFQKGLDVGRVVANTRAGSWSTSDLRGFATISAQMLARAHSQAETAEGVLGLEAIHAAIGDDHAGFVAETVAFSADYAVQLQSDYLRFIHLLEEAGPLLAYRGGGR